MDSAIDIKAIREKHGWTQEQLADYLGLDRSSISRMENGQEPKGPTGKMLRHLENLSVCIASGSLPTPTPAPMASLVESSEAAE